MPYSIPSILSNPRDKLLSYEPKVDPAEVYEQRINNENNYYEPLNSRDFQPRTYNEIENLEAQLSSGANHPADVDASQHPKHRARSYYQSPVHDYYEHPVYRPLEREDYDFEPDSRLYVEDNSNYPSKYEVELPEHNLEQQSDLIERGNDEETVNGDYVIQDSPISVHSPLNEDNAVDPQMLKTGTAGRDNEYEEFSYEPQGTNAKILPNKEDPPNTYVGDDNMTNIFRDNQVCMIYNKRKVL